jgi:hypothetical protein
MKNLLVLIIVLTSFLSYGQSLDGKWYMINRSGVIEFDLSKDSLTREKLFVDLKKKRGVESQKKVHQEILKDSLIIKIVERDSLYSPITFVLCKKDSLIKQVWNLPDTSFKRINQIELYYKELNKDLLGYNLFSSSFKNQLETRRNPDSLSLEEFNEFLIHYFKKAEVESVEAEKYVTGYLGFSSYNHQIITQTLFELNYNPFQNSGFMDSNFRLYMEEPEIKKLLEKHKK